MCLHFAYSLTITLLLILFQDQHSVFTAETERIFFTHLQISNPTTVLNCCSNVNFYTVELASDPNMTDMIESSIFILNYLTFPRTLLCALIILFYDTSLIYI